MSMNEHMDHLYTKRKQAEEGGGREKLAQQRQKGKLTARERIIFLLDQDSFIELHPFMESQVLTREQRMLGDGVVTGYGTIDGRSVYVFAQDFTVYGGALGETHARKICALMDLAAKNKAPIIGLNDSGGARIQEGVLSLDGYGHIFYRNVLYSGVIPQISVILGPCAGGAVYSPALTDFIFMAEQTGRMFITGPKVIEKVTGEQVDAESLGGAGIHNAVSGNAHFSGHTEKEVLTGVRKLLSYLPLNGRTTEPKPEKEASRPLLNRLVPADTTKPYDVRKVIRELADPQSFLRFSHFLRRTLSLGLQGWVKKQSASWRASRSIWREA